jgi:hypothetical protein
MASIANCFSNNIVTGQAIRVAGLVGTNWGGSIANCYSTSAVAGSRQVGGLVGLHGRVYYTSNPEKKFIGTISCCYFAGRISGGDMVGGAFGVQGGITETCFWDRTTTCLTETCGAIDPEMEATSCDNNSGKTTAELQTTGTFLDAGWDFEGETDNGVEDLWRILEGQDYPRLSWEAEPRTGEEPQLIIGGDGERGR